MVLKVPPPPPLANMDQAFNRWLLELTGILNAQGEIDPSTVVGLPDAYVQIGDNSTDINTLFAAINAQNFVINALNAQVTALNSQVAVLNARAQIFNGTADPVAGLGSDNDWYARTDSPNRGIFVKLAGAWVRVTAAF